jgi:hypothetical protein
MFIIIQQMRLIIRFVGLIIENRIMMHGMENIKKNMTRSDEQEIQHPV